jgi:hypothetical protein
MLECINYVSVVIWDIARAYLGILCIAMVFSSPMHNSDATGWPSPRYSSLRASPRLCRRAPFTVTRVSLQLPRKHTRCGASHDTLNVSAFSGALLGPLWPLRIITRSRSERGLTGVLKKWHALIFPRMAPFCFLIPLVEVCIG